MASTPDAVVLVAAAVVVVVALVVVVVVVADALVVVVVVVALVVAADEVDVGLVPEEQEAATTPMATITVTSAIFILDTKLFLSGF
ncbi:MAG: hypothetical protein HYX87_06810 [Chloroflexi bacterium]|nr:hypothetical protein [Chloroflexota bacterium]